MSGWRERGIVQDSDDEGAISEQDSSIHVERNKDELNRSSTRGSLRNAGSQSLPSTKVDNSVQQSHILSRTETSALRISDHDVQDLENPGSSPNGIASEVSDAPTSPLSDVPNSFDNVYKPIPGQLGQAISQPEVEDLQEFPNFGHDHLSDTNTAQNHTTNVRNFRQRNPIQLHPYLLENELYRQTLRGRGLRPVAITNWEDQHPMQSLDESQYLAHPDSDPVLLRDDPQDLFTSSASDHQISELRASSEAGSEAEAGEDELPSLADLLRNPRSRNSHGHKRQKLSHPNMQPSRPSTGISAEQTLSPITPSGPQLGLSETALSSVPNSNEHGQSTTKQRRRRRFQMPSEHGSNTLPTPLPSSEIENAHKQPISIDSGSESNQGSKDRTSAASNGQVRTGSPLRKRSVSNAREPHDSSDSDEIHKVSRRIRGVLPASWLRLDQQKQQRPSVAAKHRNILQSNTQLDTDVPKGVAKHVRSNRAADPQVNSANSPVKINLSDIVDDAGAGEDSSAESDHHVSAVTQPPLIARSSERAESTQDIREEDWIDPMLPTYSRPRVKPLHRKRQLQIKEALELKNSITPDSKTHLSRQTSIHELASNRHEPINRKKRLRMPPAPKLSILDAVESMPRASLPDFVRVAARHAASRFDKGRHGPSGKILSTHIREDTAEMRRSLKTWQRSSFAPETPYASKRERKVARSRLPLTNTSSNLQTRLPSLTRLNHTHRSPQQGDSFTSSSAHRQKQSPLESVSIQQENNAAPGQEPQPNVSRKTAPNQRHRQPIQIRRPGHLEDIQNLNHYLNGETIQRQESNRLDSHPKNVTNPLLERYLIDENQHTSNIPHENGQIASDRKTSDISKQSNRSRVRKRRPLPLLDTGRNVVRLTSPEYFLDEANLSPLTVETEPVSEYLTGLGPYGQKYTVDFGIKGLPTGTFFNSTTFVGNGELHKALKASQRNLDEIVTSTRFNFGPKPIDIGSWGQEASDSIDAALTYVAQCLDTRHDCDHEEPVNALTTNATHLGGVYPALRSIVGYYASGLSFLDPIDRRSFVSWNLVVLSRVLRTVKESKPVFQDQEMTAAKVRLQLRCLTFLTLMSYLALRVTKHPIVQTEVHQAMDSLWREYCLATGRLIAEYTSPYVEQTIKRMQQPSSSGPVFTSDDVEIESIVVLSSILAYERVPGSDLWDVLNVSFAKGNIDKIASVESFEEVWSALFNILPLLEIDNTGILRTGLRFPAAQENWIVVRNLIKRLLQLYSESPQPAGASINSYIRASISRCFVLMDRWGWRHCEPILSILFDFFARNGLASLKNEDAPFQSTFLQHLDQDFNLSVQPNDISFDIFLKILAYGLHCMRKTYSFKKIKNTAWRFLPNHGRIHAKENDLRESDLDALKNHHNLLCVLYWASPPGFRISVDLIQNLVDFSTSHSEVCRLNARSWANLTRFQLSTDEDTVFLEPFTKWLRTMLAKCLAQHKQARPEAEATFNKVKQDSTSLTNDMLESTITSNEKQLEGILTAILDSVSSLLKTARNVEPARGLFEHSSVEQLLFEFAPKKSRFTRVVRIALDSYQRYFDLIKKDHRFTASTKQKQQADEDSQDYGEWLDMDDLNGEKSPGSLVAEVPHRMIDALQCLLSNLLGAEHFHDEPFLTKVVDTWISQCQIQVLQLSKDWTYYLDTQSPGSWHQFRDTEQTSRLAPYFVGRILEIEPDSFFDNSWSVLSTWLVSLVNRESTLRYQHLLTTQLMKVGKEHPLIQNLPFSEEKVISLSDIRERRLNILSTVFCNIRLVIDGSSMIGNEMRPHCMSLLKDLMAAMKKNYLEIQQCNATRGAYVDFVQRIVEFLQQYTTDICAVEKFFTDPTTFPLPASDPTYIAGRLKSYHLKLYDLGTQKQLTVFLQAICERAVADGQQEYLVGQLVNCQSGLWKSPRQNTPSLRVFLIRAIFPRYIETTVYSSCGWLLAIPIMNTIEKIYDDLLFNFEARNETMADEVMQMSTSLVESLRKTILSLLDQDSQMMQGTNHRIFARIFTSAASMLTIIDYAHRLWRNGSKALQEMLIIHRIASIVENILDGDLQDTSISELDALRNKDTLTSGVGETGHAPFKEIEMYTAQSLKESLSTNWSHDNGRYCVRSGGFIKEITFQSQGPELDKSGLLRAIENFKSSTSQMPTLARWL